MLYGGSVEKALLLGWLFPLLVPSSLVWCALNPDIGITEPLTTCPPVSSPWPRDPAGKFSKFSWEKRRISLEYVPGSLLVDDLSGLLLPSPARPSNSLVDGLLLGGAKEALSKHIESQPGKQAPLRHAAAFGGREPKKQEIHSVAALWNKLHSNGCPAADSGLAATLRGTERLSIYGPVLLIGLGEHSHEDPGTL